MLQEKLRPLPSHQFFIAVDQDQFENGTDGKIGIWFLTNKQWEAICLYISFIGLTKVASREKESMRERKCQKFMSKIKLFSFGEPFFIAVDQDQFTNCNLWFARFFYVCRRSFPTPDKYRMSFVCPSLNSSRLIKISLQMPVSDFWPAIKCHNSLTKERAASINSRPAEPSLSPNCR